MKYLWEILVPVSWNDGEEIPLSHHLEWDSKIRSIAGGLTVLKIAKGQWVMEDKLFHERMIPVRIACTEEQIRQIAELTLLHYKQVKVMYYLISSQVFFYPDESKLTS